MWRDVPFACQRRPIIGVLRVPPPPQPPDDEMTITKFSRPVLANFDPFVSFFVICDPNQIHLHVQCIPLINLMGLMGFFFGKKCFLSFLSFGTTFDPFKKICGGLAAEHHRKCIGAIS